MSLILLRPQAAREDCTVELGSGATAGHGHEPARARWARGAAPAALELIRGHRARLGALAVTSLTGGATEAVFLVVVTRIAVAVTDDTDQMGLLAGRSVSIGWAVVIAFALAMARIALAVAGSWQSSRLTARVVARLRHRLADAFLFASWPVQQAEPTGRLQELLTSFTHRGSELVSGVALGVSAACSLLALLAIAVTIDPIGAVVMIASVVVLGAFLRPIRGAVRRRAQRAAAADLRYASGLSEISHLGLEMHVFQVQPQITRLVGGLIDASAETDRRLGFVRAVLPQVYTGLAYIALVGALAAVAFSDAADLTSLGTVMLVMLRSLSYGQAIQSNAANVAATAPFVEALHRAIDHYEGSASPAAGATVGSVGTLELRNVTFSYLPGRPVLQGVSLAIAPGSVVGIVGPSGGGKSTLVQLLLGLRQPDAGEVLADGRPIRDLDPTQWARRVTFVPQESHLMSGTIEDNIRFHREGVTADDVVRAAQLAHLDADVRAFPDGYQREVGDRGGDLSGGQQQRICIARALVEQPDVLILDEPTSSLDVQSENVVRQTLLGLRERLAVVVIAHRLSTLDICDRIAVIQDGQLKGFDTPENLARTNAFYHEALVLSGLR